MMVVDMDALYHQWRSCEVKVSHGRWSVAAREARRLNAQHGETRYRAYLCRYCGWYHVGRQKAEWSERKNAVMRRKR